MKLRVTVDGREYEVSVYDIHARPVIAVVDGVEIEVWPEAEQARSTATATGSIESRAHTSVRPATPGPGAPIQPATAGAGTSQAKTVLAPLPGVVLSVLVEVGDEVKPGQELCVIEAMKMKNIVRSSRSGVVEKIQVRAGQTVRHRDPILDFTGE